MNQELIHHAQNNQIAFLSVGVMLFAITCCGCKEARPETKEKANLMTLSHALHAYISQHGVYPNQLSDLTPDFLSDEALLVSPINQKPYQYFNPPVRINEHNVLVARQTSISDEAIVPVLCVDRRIRMLNAHELQPKRNE